jgi:hypothetical protein
MKYISVIMTTRTKYSQLLHNFTLYLITKHEI